MQTAIYWASTTILHISLIPEASLRHRYHLILQVGKWRLRGKSNSSKLWKPAQASAREKGLGSPHLVVEPLYKLSIPLIWHLGVYYRLRESHDVIQGPWFCTWFSSPQPDCGLPKVWDGVVHSSHLPRHQELEGAWQRGHSKHFS